MKRRLGWALVIGLELIDQIDDSMKAMYETD